MRFRKKPVVIEASQWFIPGDHPKVVQAPMGGTANGAYGVHTATGFALVSPGDWIITGITGEVYPCRKEIFEATYEPE